VPEAFKLLVKELQSLGINVEILNNDEQRIQVVEESSQDEMPELGVNLSGFEHTEAWCPMTIQAGMLVDERDKGKLSKASFPSFLQIKTICQLISYLFTTHRLWSYSINYALHGIC
jgi:hypothetical protein